MLIGLINDVLVMNYKILLLLIISFISTGNKSFGWNDVDNTTPKFINTFQFIMLEGRFHWIDIWYRGKNDADIVIVKQSAKSRHMELRYKEGFDWIANMPDNDYVT